MRSAPAPASSPSPGAPTPGVPSTSSSPTTWTPSPRPWPPHRATSSTGARAARARQARGRASGAQPDGRPLPPSPVGGLAKPWRTAWEHAEESLGFCLSEVELWVAFERPRVRRRGAPCSVLDDLLRTCRAASAHDLAEKPLRHAIQRPDKTPSKRRMRTHAAAACAPIAAAAAAAGYNGPGAGPRTLRKPPDGLAGSSLERRCGGGPPNRAHSARPGRPGRSTEHAPGAEPELRPATSGLGLSAAQMKAGSHTSAPRHACMAASSRRRPRVTTFSV